MLWKGGRSVDVIIMGEELGDVTESTAQLESSGVTAKKDQGTLDSHLPIQSSLLIGTSEHLFCA